MTELLEVKNLSVSFETDQGKPVVRRRTDCRIVGLPGLMQIPVNFRVGITAVIRPFIRTEHLIIMPMIRSGQRIFWNPPAVRWERTASMRGTGRESGL